MSESIFDGACRIVVNHEQQYSIWPVDRLAPAGWQDEGTHGTRQECLDRIEQIWSDMRLLSLRQRTDGRER
jgi:MbtH protein